MNSRRKGCFAFQDCHLTTLRAPWMYQCPNSRQCLKCVWIFIPETSASRRSYPPYTIRRKLRIIDARKQ
ncbi:hypothetical protein J1614_001984 [Plenodomus biglobosus]|nr:hypothetical protein J1614_001984 [Plenodomus biglobosus]